MSIWKDMKSQLIVLGVGVSLGLAGMGALHHSGRLTTQEELDALHRKCQEVDSTAALVVGSPRKVTTKLGKIEVVMHEYTLALEVGGQICTAQVSMKAGDRTGSMNVWYPKSAPQEASLDNPCLELKRFQAEKTVGPQSMFLFGGIGMLLLGMAMAGSGIKNLIVMAIRGKK